MGRRRLSRRFWLLNTALLLLYGWTFTEEATITIQVTGGRCIALLPGREIAIPCPGLAGGYLGLYLSDPGERQLGESGPLDWLAPRSAWRDVRYAGPGQEVRELSLSPSRDVPGWRHIFGEWRPVDGSAAMRWRLPFPGEFSIEATLRRPDEGAGILFLRDGGDEGWAFLTSPRGRRGVWWTWRDGELVQPIVGIPFQSSFLAQSQSLLRRLLLAHQGGLVLLTAAWLLSRLPLGRLVQTAKDRWRMFQARPILRWLSLLSRHGQVEMVAASSLALLATLLIANTVLERLPHVQDSITYLFQAQTLAQGGLTAAAPALPEFFEQEFLLVRDGHWYGKYSPGFPALLALGVLLKQPWLVNPILATLTIPLLYGLGVSLYGRGLGRLAIVLVLFSPFFLFMSGSMMAHPAELLWLCLFMLGWIRSWGGAGDTVWTRGKERRWIFVAGVALGMAFLTRTYTTLAVGVPFLAVTGLARSRDRATAGYHAVAARAALLIALLSPFALLLLGYQWAVTGDPFQDPRLLYWEFDRPGFGPDVGMGHNAFTLSEWEEELAVNWFYDPAQPPNGHTPARGIYNTELNWRALETHLFGWPALFSLAFCWLAFLLRRPGWFDVALLLAAAALIAAYVLFWSSGIMYGPRYYYAALPAFLLLTARGIQAAGEWVGGRDGRYGVACLVGLLVLGNLLFYLPHAVAGYRSYNFVSGEPLAQTRKFIQGKGIVFVEENGDGWWEYGEFFSGNTPRLDGDVIYARDLGAEKNRSLLALYPQYQAYQWRAGELSVSPATTPPVDPLP